jgi:hypothetical protein
VIGSSNEYYGKLTDTELMHFLNSCWHFIVFPCSDINFEYVDPAVGEHT